MSHYADLVLIVIVMVDLFILATTRLGAAIRGTAIQGAMLSLLPIVLSTDTSWAHFQHVALIAAVTFILKAVVLPWYLLSGMRKTKIRREVEPFVSRHVSLLLGALLVGLAFWSSDQLPMPGVGRSPLLVPVAFATLFIGFLIVVSRKKAITQVLGYLMMENGVFVFGMSLAYQLPFVVEFGILLDVLVAILVFGVLIQHISAEFDSIDTDVLSELKD